MITLFWEESLRQAGEYFDNHPEVWLPFERDGNPVPETLDDATDWQLYAYLTSDYTDGRIDDEGNLLTTWNPKAKWDYYQLGGRWSGLLRTKAGGEADEARAADIDFSFDREKYEEALRFWQVYIEDAPLEEGESREDFDAWASKDYYRNRYNTAEDYAESASRFSTYSVLDIDGNWHECPLDDKEETLWYNNYRKNFLMDLDPGWWVSVIDYHS